MSNPLAARRSRSMSVVGLAVATCLVLAGSAVHAGEDVPEPAGPKLVDIELPAPETEGGMPLMEALAKRRTVRDYDADRELPLQELSNLLWAAFGVNRPDTGKRTAPSAVNWQEIGIYVALASGLYRYDEKKHLLVMLDDEDIRAETGLQEFVADAPVNLVYVADFDRMKRASEKDKKFYSAADTGFISQNVYLYCASAGLGTVVRGLVARDELRVVMGLRKNEKIILTQSVGYPAGGE